MFKDIPKENIRIIIEMIANRINSPNTSSLGRLFDGIAAITGTRTHVYNEGQAAMELEMCAAEDMSEYYEYEWESEDIYMVKPESIIRGIVSDMGKGIETGKISSRFHMTLIRLYTDLSEVIGKDTGLRRVALSGGVFQNSILLRGLKKSLENNGFEVFIHKRVPANDGGISLGQAMVAAANY
jgi:hydrogenase maturation protein HypF